MTYYTFRFDCVLSDCDGYVDLDFYDEQPGNDLRYWKMWFGRGTGVFSGDLFMSETVEDCFEEYRDAMPEEIEAMWRVLPSHIKLKYSLYRKQEIEQ